MGGGNQAPQAYTPAYQSGADSSYYKTLSGLTQQNQATAATAAAGYDTAYKGVVNNPYDASMLAGINTAAGAATGVGQADLSQSAAMNDQATQGYADANVARGYAAPMAADATTLRQYAPELIELGLDPNMSEYNYGLKTTQDTQNVQNAEQGIAGSPFAAGATGDAMAAYTRNYQVAQGSKYMAALQALSQLYGAAGGLDTSAIAGLDTAGHIATNAGNLAVGAADLGNTGVQEEALGASMPYTASNQVQQDQMAALDELVNGNTAASGAVQGDVQGYGNYLNIGQGATALDQNAAKINAQNSFMGQLGQILGQAAGIGAHFIPGYK